MNNINQAVSAGNINKIIFTLRKPVKYGQGIFVCGSIPELGTWRPESAFRLKWCQGDVWTGTLQLSYTPSAPIQFKYIIADYEHPSSRRCEWESGYHNRRQEVSSPTKTVLCDDRWNMEKINLNLYIGQKCSTEAEDRYYVVGDLPELGNWKEPKLMKRIRERSNAHRKSSSNLLSHLRQEKNQVYSYSFYTFRQREQFRYYYIKKGQALESQRKPGRIFHFQNQREAHPQRIGVTYKKAEITIHDNCGLNDLKFSQITPQIYVGSYPKTAQDLQRLKQHNISAIFSIQSEKDYKHHGLSPHFFKLLCEEHGIKFKRYAIEDMNNDDFILRAQGGLKILNELLKEGLNVYIHCSAGIYRSPQMIALYLAMFQHQTVEQAIQLVKSNHPFARPNTKVVKEAIGMIRNRRSRSRLYV